MLLTVENLPAGSSVRLAVMDRFDGNVWNLSDSTMSSAPPITDVSAPPSQQCRRQEIHRHIHRGQRTQRLLAAHGRSRIQRDIRQQRKLRLVLLQQRHHVGPSTPHAPPKVSPTRKPASCQRFPPTNRSPNRRGRHQPAKSRRCARLRRQTRHSHRRRPIKGGEAAQALAEKLKESVGSHTD